MYDYGLSLDADAPCGARGILYPIRFIKAARQKGLGPEDYSKFSSYWNGLEDFQKIAFMATEDTPIPEEAPPPLEQSVICPDYEVADDVENALVNLKYMYSRDPNIELDCDKHFSGSPSGKWRKKENSK